ncbi:MAG: hypothetical protein SF066_20455, partial [Thermoanaerobaculia bacterium]|nr:hypothetical protein [Thermoanaerobaculia bacterium]
MAVPHDARPFADALERAYHDGLRADDACLRALELVTLERGSDASKNLLTELRSLLEGNLQGFELPPMHLVIARANVEKLAELTHAKRLTRIRASNKLRGPAIGEALLERARAALPADPKESGSWAECAVRAMTYSDTEERREADHITVCLARGLAFWGNSLRVLCDLRGAEKLIRQADDTLEFFGIGNLAARAELASFRGSLQRARRDFEEAILSLELAEAGWNLLGDLGQQARVCLKISHTHGLADRPQDALEAVRSGIPLLERLDDPRLAWSFRHNEAWFLEGTGLAGESRQAADAARQLAAEFPDSFTQLRVQWLEGRLCRSEGRPDEAVDHFRAVQTGFLADQNPYDAALVSLDLATLYLETGRHTEVVELATAMRAAFEALGVHREALAAWRLFTDACQRQAANVQLAKNLARYLD